MYIIFINILTFFTYENWWIWSKQIGFILQSFQSVIQGIYMQLLFVKYYPVVIQKVRKMLILKNIHNLICGVLKD